MASSKKIFRNLGSSDAPVVIAHRGFSEEAPENSLAAFHKAVEAKADMFELDVRLSADNEFVVFHDKKLNRTSDGHGPLKKFTAKELSGFDNGTWFSRKFSRERIPLLKDILPLTKRGIGINIEIKPDVVGLDGFSVEEEIVRLIAKFKATHRVMFSSFNHSTMRAIKRIDSSIVTGILYNPIADFRHSPSQLAARAHADIFICSKYQLNGDVMHDAHKADCRVYVYGVKSERDVARMVHLGADGIIADNPAMVKSAIASLLR